jgi:DNA-binding GntR family transcriptional regulator
VSDRLRLDILSGYYAPKQRLIEADVAHHYGVSRAEVRVAYFELANEGLVERFPNRGAYVRHVTMDEAIAIREVQLGVQQICAARAAELATSSEIAVLSSMLSEMADAVDRNDLIRYYEYLHQLHAEIRVFSRQLIAGRVSQQLLDQANQHRLMESFAPGRMEASLREHARIVAAIQAHNPEEAEEATRELRISVVAACREVASRTSDSLRSS